MSKPDVSVDVKPQTKAWLAFEKQAAIGGLLDPATVGAPETKYLRNRLWRAFNAGWDAAKADPAAESLTASPEDV